jgi:hypothetical protein
MRFIMMIQGDKNYEAGKPPDPRLNEAIGKLAQDMTKSGVLLSTEGLLPSSRGARVTVANGKLMVTDGPFAETKEIIGGFAIVQVRSKQAAIEMGSDFMELHRQILGPEWEGVCEIRELSERGEP